MATLKQATTRTIRQREEMIRLLEGMERDTFFTLHRRETVESWNGFLNDLRKWRKERGEPFLFFQNDLETARVFLLDMEKAIHSEGGEREKVILGRVESVSALSQYLLRIAPVPSLVILDLGLLSERGHPYHVIASSLRISLSEKKDRDRDRDREIVAMRKLRYCVYLIDPSTPKPKK